MKRFFLLPLLIVTTFAQSPTPGSRTVLNNPKVQTDIDMANHKLLNTDMSSVMTNNTATIYVSSVTGHDSGSMAGSRGTPLAFATLSAAITAASDGDTIEILTDLAAGANIPSKSNLKINGNGHTISVSEGTLAVLWINGSTNVSISDLGINGNRVSSTATPDQGVILVQSSTNSTMRNVNVHDAVGYAFRYIGDYSGAKNLNCEAARVYRGIMTATPTTDVVNVTVDNFRCIDPRDRGVRFNGDFAGGFFVRRLTLSNIVVTASSHISAAGVEIFGGQKDILASNIAVYNFDYPVSFDHCVRVTATNINARAGGVLSIEFASCLGFSLSNYYIDGANDSGTNIAAHGVSVSNSYATSNDTGPNTITGGTIEHLNGKSFSIQNTNDVLIVGNTVRNCSTDGGTVNLQASSGVTYQANRTSLTLSTDGSLVIDGAERGADDVQIIGNTFNQTGGNKIIRISEAQSHALTNIGIVGNTKPGGGSLASGYVFVALSGGGTLTGLVQYDNSPNTLVWGNGQTGFADSLTQYDITATDSYTLGTHSSSSTATPRVIDMGGSFSSTAGANPKLELFNDGIVIYGLGISSSQMDFAVPTGAGYAWYINGTKKVSINSSGQLITLLPTSCSGLGTGTLYNNAGTPAICP